MCASNAPGFIVPVQPLRACITSLRAAAVSVCGVGEALGVGVPVGVGVGVVRTTVVLLLLLDGSVLPDVVLVETLPLRVVSFPLPDVLLSFRTRHAPMPPMPRRRTVVMTVTATTEVVLRCFGELAGATSCANSLTVGLPCCLTVGAGFWRRSVASLSGAITVGGTA